MVNLLGVMEEAMVSQMTIILKITYWLQNLLQRLDKQAVFQTLLLLIMIPLVKLLGLLNLKILQI